MNYRINYFSTLHNTLVYKVYNDTGTPLFRIEVNTPVYWRTVSSVLKYDTINHIEIIVRDVWNRYRNPEEELSAVVDEIKSRNNPELYFTERFAREASLQYITQ